jgi:hypothetical protein
MKPLILTAALALALLTTSGALATHGSDAEVTVGSADAVFSQNKQNEPAAAVNPINPLIVAAGANDNIDLEACNAGDPTTCPFTDGVGVSGVQFSLNGGNTWTQPTYTGWTARHCVGPPGFTCTPALGPIGTLPWYYENGLVSDGDPSVAWGPQPGPGGTFSWANGARLYYANLTANFSSQRDEQTFKGFEAIAVSRTDNAAAAATGSKAAWLPPVIVSRQNAALFSDKEQVWADNAASSPFFGNVYICNVAFRSVGGAPEPVVLHRSTDGGDTWSQRQLSPAANTGLGQGRQGCTVRTDSRGIVYVFWSSADKKKDNPPFFDSAQLLARSFNGGRTFERPFKVADVVDCGQVDPVQGRLTFDGIAGSRTNSFPSVDIANGAPTGAGATDRIVMTWCDASGGLNNEEALVQTSTTRGVGWSAPVDGAEAADRPDFPAIAISPDGQDVYLTYMGFLDPWRTETSSSRRFQGVVRYAPWPATAWTTLHRGAIGDARASSANSLATEFLGDYNYVAATNDFAVAVWNDARNATVCPAINAYRQSLATGTPIATPAPQVACAPTFGNTDIYGTREADPTP